MEEKKTKESYELLEKEIQESKKECYKIQFEKDNQGKNTDFISICPENVYKINAMILANSSYKNSANPGAYPVIKNSNKKTTPNEYVYLGSSAFWFSKLKEYVVNNKGLAETTKVEVRIGTRKKSPDEKKYSLKEIVGFTVFSVDNENSTHLNADKKGREALTNRLYDLVLSNELLKMLQNQEHEYVIIPLLSNKTYNKKSQCNDLGNCETDRFYVSFASKWCHYACMYMFTDEENRQHRDNFSIVDRVLKKSLYKYKEYANTGAYKEAFKEMISEDRLVKGSNNIFNILNDSTLMKDEYFINSIPNVSDRKKSNVKIAYYYDEYIKIIDTVRNLCDKDKEISRNGLDHLLWYSNKGLFSDKDDSDD